MKIWLSISGANRCNYPEINIPIETSKQFDLIRAAMLGINWNAHSAFKCFVSLFTRLDNGDLINIEQVMIDENSIETFLEECGEII